MMSSLGSDYCYSYSTDQASVEAPWLDPASASLARSADLTTRATGYSPLKVRDRQPHLNLSTSRSKLRLTLSLLNARLIFQSSTKLLINISDKLHFSINPTVVFRFYILIYQFLYLITSLTRNIYLFTD